MSLRDLNNLHREWRPILVIVWICHFTVSVLIITWVGLQSEDHKYIPVDVNAIGEEDGKNGGSQCAKAYVDVRATSIHETGAFVCCMPSDDEGICRTIPWYLYFVRRLVHFPEVILLPLFPLLLRGIMNFVTQQQGGSDSTQFKRQQEINIFTGRRFILYICLIQIRWWVLYILFNAIEDQIFVPEENVCWYDNLLRKHHIPCQGKAFDFSDHIVLYFAQILPIMLTEVLFSFVTYWRYEKVQRTVQSTSISSKVCSSTIKLKTVRLVPIILTVGMLYLYVISFFGTYTTVAYFHTSSEVIIGYLISLLVQIPLFLIQCTSLMEYVRDYFFGRII